jgi:hypothetical protein
LFDTIYSTSKKAWASAQVDIVLTEGREFIQAQQGCGAITSHHCADLIAYIEELQIDAAKLFGATVNGRSGVFTFAGTMRLDWHTNGHEGSQREYAGHAGLPGATASTTLSTAATLSQAAGERRVEEANMLREREGTGISRDQTLPKAVREAYISSCCKAMSASLAKGGHYCYFKCSSGSAAPTPTKEEPWRVIAVWSPTASTRERKFDFGPRLHYGHLMEVYEQGGEERIACFTKECQQRWFLCPHVAGWHQCVGVGDARKRYLRSTFDGSRDQEIFTSEVRKFLDLPFDSSFY